MKITVRIFLTTIAVGFFLYCGWNYFAVSGHWSVTTYFFKDTRLISTLYPAGRALVPEKKPEIKPWSQTVVGEPVYFNINPAQLFKTVTLTVDMQPKKQRFVQIGVVTTKEPFAAQVQLLYSALLEEVRAAAWHRIEEDGKIMYTSRSDIASLSDLYSNAEARIATSGVDMNVAQSIPECTKIAGENFTIPAKLVGDHDFAFALSSSEQARKVTLASSSDALSFVITDAHKEQVIAQATYENGTYVAVIPPSATPAVYYARISRAAGVVLDAVTFPTSCVSAQRVVFESVADSIHLFSTNKKLTFIALKPEVFATPLTGSFGELAMHALNAPQVRYSDALAYVDVPTGGVSITSNGFLSFAADTTFDPRGRVLPLDETTTMNDVDVLVVDDVTTYTIAHNYSYRRFYTTLDLSKIADRHALQFMISAPGIAAQEGSLELFRIEADFFTDPLWIRATRTLTRFFSL